jgi:D-glycero-D-manno-heptose 1,7-bisphosphate phosphatase
VIVLYLIIIRNRRYSIQLAAKPLVILDRDGVINYDSDAYIKTPEEWQAIPGSISAIARLKQAGYLVAVATNQSGIARGLFDLATLASIHEKMLSLINDLGESLDALVICPHGPDENCSCRKPKPGLLLKIKDRLSVSLTGAYVVGDSLRDLQAAVGVGANPVLVRTGKGISTVSQIAETDLAGTPVFSDLEEFTNFILTQGHAKHRNRTTEIQ